MSDKESKIDKLLLALLEMIVDEASAYKLPPNMVSSYDSLVVYDKAASPGGINEAVVKIDDGLVLGKIEWDNESVEFTSITRHKSEVVFSMPFEDEVQAKCMSAILFIPHVAYRMASVMSNACCLLERCILNPDNAGLFMESSIELYLKMK